MKKNIPLLLAMVVSGGINANSISFENDDFRIELREERMSRSSRNLKACRRELRDAQDDIDELVDAVRDLRAENNRLKDLLDARDPAPRPPHRARVACEDEGVFVFKDTIVKMKAFAYSGDGYNYTSNASTTFANNWIKEYACEDADLYIKTFKRLKTFAYSGSGLNYTSNSAVNFASQKLTSFCSDYQLEEKYSELYQFAYSSNGLNYTSNSARKYAFDAIKEEAFSCANPFSLDAEAIYNDTSENNDSDSHGALYYTIESGDTISSIAARFDLNIKQLIRLNLDIKDINRISIGMRIRVR
ncbi:MAG: LysM peptidoglycan-binding domain-containing protein [Bdellovibrionota bacterium]|nr:LysM peptidoglycan-binding domain-containing protein [Bdellovibrionota bacterium]